MDSARAVFAAVNGLFTPRNLTAAALAVAAWQLFLAARFAARLRRQSLRPAGTFSPRVVVIVACKGRPRGFAANISSILGQRYAGDAEFLFVTPSAQDPAAEALRVLLADRRDARLLVSGAVPERCSEKILNLLYALARASPDREALVFADCDVELPADWLSRLVAPLERADVVAVSAPALYAADTLNPLQSLRMAWMALVQCSLDYFGSVIGWSWAIRREDFARLHVARVWSRSLTDDFVLNPLLRRTGRRIEWALSVMPVCRENPGLSEVLVPFVKGFQYFRVNDKALWVMGGLEAFGKLYLTWWFWRFGMPWRAAMLPAVDAAAALLVWAAVERWGGKASGAVHPALRRWPAAALAAALAAPAMLALRPWIFLVSAATKKVRWGGYVYEFNAADDCRVVGAAS